MTQKEFFTHVSLNTISAEDIDYATETLRKMNDSASARSAKKKAEDAPLVASLVEYLTNSAKVLTASEIALHFGISTSKATALCKQIENIKVSDVQVDRRMVKGYSL